MIILLPRRARGRARSSLTMFEGCLLSCTVCLSGPPASSFPLFSLISLFPYISHIRRHTRTSLAEGEILFKISISICLSPLFPTLPLHCCCRWPRLILSRRHRRRRPPTHISLKSLMHSLRRRSRSQRRRDGGRESQFRWTDRSNEPSSHTIRRHSK